ncbi:disulfide bond formation protein B [Paracoccus aestuarii]|uniref:Disulfide bond formation protein B n=2 Tax=Paracoccus TaxID=265 RepID=A0A418ZNZ6_9RHOB|nr:MULTISPECIES: disulfide bond formation protein B [Paracoccus]RJK93513.1 disulfide bond formation protein B [Paracoccus aestuarii]WCQ99083.1 disulfide bond formation protein B [Paracoccus aestuarii]WCR01311.1 disulfide bond formation protein B [Paracoccus aestuarii]SCY89770.1 disulfide bond formation protein DsbB [Paracoccus tibetensis]
MTATKTSRVTRDELTLLAAFLIALTATLGALFIGEVLGQMPCVLCWYQRIAMFPLTVILAVALWRSDVAARAYALPLVIVGLALAVWHSGLYMGLIPETITPCTQTGPSCSDKAQMTILGLPIPYLSVAAFSLIGLCLLNVKGSRP